MPKKVKFIKSRCEPAQEKIKAPKNSGYSEAGASYKRRALKSFIPQSHAPYEDIDFNNATLRQRGRMLYMASPIAAGAIHTNRTKIVGSGLHLKCSLNREILGISETAAEEWQKKTEAEWNMWANSRDNCDALGCNNFYELQGLAVESWLMSGDVFALLKRERPTRLNPYSLRIHLIEADRISTPSEYVKGASPNLILGENKNNGNKIFDGVEVNSSGKAVAYHVCNVYYPNQTFAEIPKWERVKTLGAITKTPNILQIMDAERPDQYRGVTYLAPVIEILLQLRRYTESELTAALVQSYFTAWITTAMPDKELPTAGGSGGIYDPDSAGGSIGENENNYEMGPGTINLLNEGEDIEFGNPNIPTAGFETFVKSICRMAGSALELPYDVLVKEFNSSYSAAKGALEEAWDMFKMRRTWFVSDFCQPVYEAWLSEAVAAGRIKAPGFFENPLIRAAWCGSRWDGPAQIHLDPEREAGANVVVAAHGWKTNEQITREFYGSDWDENISVMKRENESFRNSNPIEFPAVQKVQREDENEGDD